MLLCTYNFKVKYEMRKPNATEYRWPLLPAYEKERVFYSYIKTCIEENASMRFLIKTIFQKNKTFSNN